jgi:hypothetical protein
MLPGFRFLFGAIVLCFSIVIFGLGAAALLRAAHEQFVSRPSWQATPGTMLAQQNEPFAQQSEASRAVLALLEVEPDDRDLPRETSGEAPTETLPEMARDGALDGSQQPSAGETTAVAPDPAADTHPEPEKPVVSDASDQPVSAIANDLARSVPIAPELEQATRLEPEMSPGEATAATERTTSTVVTEPEGTTTVASVSDTAPNTGEPPIGTPEPSKAPAIGPEPPAARIAALGGSPEATEAQAREKEASAARAKAYRNFIRNRLRAHRAARERRRLAHRAHVARRATAQQQQQQLQQQQVLPAPFTPLPSGPSPYRF